jgi:histidinol-phosphate aminotransferase
MVDILSLLRKNIRSLTPYSSARDEYKGEEAVFLDANENPYNNPINRYPDPLQIRLKNRIAEIKEVAPENIFLGNGSDEAIDLLIRAFCEPGIDNILAMKPTYGMYKVCADINGIEYRESLLNENFQLNVGSLLELADNHSKLLFLCSPNNPTSNSLDAADILHLLRKFRGLVILDEAYIDFSIHPAMTAQLKVYPNLVILQTFSKAWGMAGIRLGMAFADREIIQVLNRIKYPYNVNILTQKVAMEHLASSENKERWVNQILEQRDSLKGQLKQFSIVKNILPSDANFLMVKFDDAKKVFDFLIDRKIIIRDRSKIALCEGYLRITIGTSEENRMLIQALNEY